MLDEAQQQTVVVQPGDEVLALPAWGLIGGTLGTLLISFALSYALSALTYVLFPPQKPHIDGPEEHTFSFQGIRTAIGPGNVVPVIYGTHRVGGQLLSASVEQAMYVIDNNLGSARIQANASPPTLTMLVALGEGPVDNIIHDSVEMNGQPLSNFLGVQLDSRLGDTPQTPMVNFGEIRNTFSDGRDLPDDTDNLGQFIVYTTTQAVTAFILTIVFEQGLFHINGKGEKEDNSVNISYSYKISGAGGYTTGGTFVVSAQRTAPVRFSIRRENLPAAVYDINLNFAAPRHTADPQSQWTPTLESVTECQTGTQTYDGTALLALRAVATDALQGSLPNLTVTVRGRKVRIGTFATGGEGFSDNPAWCVMDFLTNSRYGLGVPDSEIDLAAFQAWADYCEEVIDGEPRHRFGYVLDRDMRAQAVLLEMMGGSRTVLIKTEGVWSPRPTRNTAPVQLLSWANTSNLRITYTRDMDRVNVMEARFSNEDTKYEQDVLTWPTVDNWPGEVHKASLDIRGVTKPSRIMRALQFELNRRHFENCLLTMDCMLDAVVLQLHDVFRFSHPLPGWGASGRLLPGCTTTTLLLDQEVTMQVGQAYHVYVKHTSDVTEVRPVVNTGGATQTLTLLAPLGGTPIPYEALWAFGLSTPDTTVKLFRVTKLQRKSDTTVHLEAVIHNPSIYDEPEASPLPGPPGLFNPLGPPPPLTHLTATELVRIQPSGASAHVANLSWDIAPLGPTYAPYGGAHLLRRTVLDNSTAGNAQAGTAAMGEAQQAAEQNLNYTLVQTVLGHILDYDDYTVLSGATYVYMVIPISGRSVPNQAGALEVLLHMTGGSGPAYFPGTVANLRLLGQAVGVTTWEGRDVHVTWDPVPDPGGVFSTTFFVQDYIVQVWAPGQEYLLRSVTQTGRIFHYTFEMNIEDQTHAGQAGARRDMTIFVWARTNTGRISLTPAALAVINPPPDMSVIELDTLDLFQAAIIAWDQYKEPRDFDHYTVYLDTTTPPTAVYEDIAIAFHGQGSNARKVFPQGLTAGVPYYTYVLPWDTFGPGIPTGIATLTPAALDPGAIDTTPPETPTGLTLTAGNDVSPDGTIQPWVRAAWDRAPESDVAGYEVHVFIDPSPVPTVYNPTRDQHAIQFPVPGGVLIRVRLLTFDRVHNISPFCPEATITVGSDTVPPLPPTNLVAFGSIRAIALLWTPPPDPDYAYSQVIGSTINDINTFQYLGTGVSNFTHEGLGANETWYYWIRAFDTSGNGSATWYPNNPVGGIAGTAGQLNTTFISDLAANKITAGTINALVSIGVANRIFLDGVNDLIYIYDLHGQVRILLGKLGALADQWGLYIVDATGAIQWNFATGATTAGITDSAVNGAKITAGAISAGHLVTTTAVITGAAQIANAIIGDAHITTVQANKITAGVLQALYYIGVGPALGLILDGTNQRLLVYDQTPTPRIDIGKLGPGPYDYGMYMWNAAGQLMLDFNTGVSQFGIQDLAITNAKIGNLEVDNAKIANLTIGTGKIQANAISEQVLFSDAGGGIAPYDDYPFAVITFPTLQPGDKVLLIGKCATSRGGYGSVSTFISLREDSVVGATFDVSEAGGSDPTSLNTHDTLTTMFVYTVGSPLVNKTFLLVVNANQLVSHARLLGIRLQK